MESEKRHFVFWDPPPKLHREIFCRPCYPYMDLLSLKSREVFLLLNLKLERKIKYLKTSEKLKELYNKHIPFLRFTKK